MLLNVSYNNPEIRKKIDTEVGKPFSFLERIKQRGIGIGHLIITSSSSEIQKLLTLDKYRNKCNIELRPNGIIIGFRSLLESYALVIPYWKLTLYKGKAEEYSLYRDTYCIKIEAKNKNVHQFIKRILAEKEKQVPLSVENL